MKDGLNSETSSPTPSPLLRIRQKDGARAWLVVLGSFCSMMCTFGTTTAFGVFQSYYETDLLPNQNPSQIAWIGSIQYFLLFFLGLPIGILHERGYTRWLLLVGSSLVVLSQLIQSWCTQYWHLLLVQSLMFGIGSGMNFTPACSVVAPWFDEYRYTALGIIAVGSASGGVAFSSITTRLLPKIGFAWTCRVMALMSLCLLIVSCLTIQPYEQKASLTEANDKDELTSKVEKLQTRFVAEVPAIINNPYRIYILGIFLASSGMYLPVTYLQDYVVRIGLSANYLAYLVPITNASSIPGRLIAGILADRYGVIITMIPAVIICAVLCFVWTLFVQPGAILAFAIVFGLFQGAYVSLLPAGVAFVQGNGPLGGSIGFMFSFISFATLYSPPVFGALITEEQSSKAYFNASMFGGCVLVASAGTFVIAQWVHHQWLKRNGEVSPKHQEKIDDDSET